MNIFSCKKGAIIKIVYGCNHNCSFCHERDNIYSLNFRNILLSDLEEIYTWIYENNFDYVIISGGEPSLHPQFVDIILFFQERNIYVNVVTNGTHLLKHSLTKIDQNKITFYISYHGIYEVYNTVTQSNDFLVLDGVVQEMISLGFPEIILRLVINNINYESIDTITEYVFHNYKQKVYLEYILVEDLEDTHILKTIVSLQDFYRVTLKNIKNYGFSRILLDGGLACFEKNIFQIAQKIYDPLVNTMVGLVKKEKTGILVFDIKSGVSPKNIKGKLKKCNLCTKQDICHGADILYFKK